MAQAVRRSPPTAGVPNSSLGHSMWVSWWTKRSLSRFFSGFLLFSPATNIIPSFLHTHLIHFVSFHCIVLLIAIRPSDGDVKPGGPLGAFREAHAMSRVAPSPSLSASSHTTQLHYTNSYTYSHPNLNFLQYIIQILVPHVMWSAQAVRELKIDHTQRHLSAFRGTRSI